MEHITIKTPHRISDFLRINYPGYSLICTKEDTDKKGQVLYIVDLLHGEMYHHLRISEYGKLIHQENETQFVGDYHEQYY